MNLSCLSGLSCANMFPGNLQNNLDLNSFGGSWWCAHQEAIHLSSVPSSCWHCIICWFCSEIPSTLTTNLLSTDTEMLSQWSYSSPLDLLAMYASVLLKNHFPSLKVLFTKSPNHIFSSVDPWIHSSFFSWSFSPIFVAKLFVMD